MKINSFEESPKKRILALIANNNFIIQDSVVTIPRDYESVENAVNVNIDWSQITKDINEKIKKFDEAIQLTKQFNGNVDLERSLNDVIQFLEDAKEKEDYGKYKKAQIEILKIWLETANYNKLG